MQKQASSPITSLSRKRGGLSRNQLQKTNALHDLQGQVHASKSFVMDRMSDPVL